MVLQRRPATEGTPSGRARRRGSACLALSLLLAAPAESQETTPLGEYLATLRDYRLGSHYDAALALRSLDWQRTEDAIRDLIESWPEAPEAEGVRRSVEAAVLLHTEASRFAAKAGDVRTHGRQALAARRLLRELDGRRKLRGDGGQRVRELYIAATSAHLEMGAMLQANLLLVEYFAARLGRGIALRDEVEYAEFPAEELGLANGYQVQALIARFHEEEADARALLLGGVAQDVLADNLQRTRLKDRSPRSEAARRRAEAFFRAGLELEPDSPELRVRLGWSLVRRGETREARALLEAVGAGPASDVQRYLAHLFLGRLLERSGDHPAALEAFERAAATIRDAPAARLAVARERERAEGPRVARALVARWLVAAGARGTGPGPWTRFGTGPEDLQMRPLRALRRELALP